MATYYSTDGKVGVDVENVGDLTQQHKLGTTARLDGNKVAIYCYLGEAITVTSGSAEPLEIAATFTASASAGGFTLNIANASTGSPTVVFASGSYVWAIDDTADIVV